MDHARLSRIRALCAVAVAVGFEARERHAKLFKPAPRHGLAGTLLDIMEDGANAVRRQTVKK